MNDRSYAQIRWRQNRLGLLMTNVCRQRFFIYAEKLSALFKEPGCYKEVKIRDRKPGRAIGYYAGQVLGILAPHGDGYQITLIVGDPLQNIDYDPKIDQAPLDYLTEMRFNFPISELTLFNNTLEIMHVQTQQFDEYITAAEATPLESKRKNIICKQNRSSL